MASASLVRPHLRSGFSNHHGDFCPSIAAEVRVRGENRLGAARPMALSVRSSFTKQEEPLVLRAAVSAATELLRVFNRDSTVKSEPEGVNELTIASEDIVGVLRSDFAGYYFLTGWNSKIHPKDLPVVIFGPFLSCLQLGQVGTEKCTRRIFQLNSGNFTDALYAENCFFADPTVQFTGRDLYKRNLRLLVPFYEDPSLVLDDIQEVGDGESKFVQAFWRLRVYLKLPWKPLIAVDGSTKYELDAKGQIVKHVETWNITGVEAIGQLFKPSERAFWRRSRSG